MRRSKATTLQVAWTIASLRYMDLRADPEETSRQRGFELSAIVLGIGELTNASVKPSLASRFSTFRKTCHFLA